MKNIYLMAVAVMLLSVSCIAQKPVERKVGKETIKGYIKPHSLKAGDKVMVLSPAGSPESTYVDKAMEELRSWGLRPVLSKHAMGSYHTYSGTVSERLSDIKEALNDDSIQAVVCTRGGYGFVHLLEGITAKDIRKNPKWFVGYSDITAYHAASTHYGVMSLHAPMCEHLARSAEDSSTLYLRKILFGDAIKYSFEGYKYNKPGKVTATLLGGNFAVLMGLFGTPYDFFNNNDFILFIEDVDESMHNIERMMYNLKLAGKLKHLKGLIIGQFTSIKSEDNTVTTYSLIRDVVNEYNIPICYNFPVGHVKRNYPMIEGATVTLDVSKDSVSLKFE